MEEFARIVSVFFNEPQFWGWFWFIMGWVASFWNGFYFFGKPSFSEKELEEISPNFLAISAKYQLFMIGWLIFTMLLIALSADNFVLLVPVFPFQYTISVLIPSYGISQGVFALLYGVYPQGKILRFIYTDKSFLRRVAIFQIATSIVSAVMLFIYGQNIWGVH
ncbi:MAG: hypothetical protein HY867_15040 [Chloroflexi bacterium]|nr:hypothetical protein [Chloroflexota bacterium]